MKTRLEELEGVFYAVEYAYNVSNDRAVDELLLPALQTLQAMIKAEKVEVVEAA